VGKIFLVGLPGSGKTFLGNKLSKKLNIPFFDDASMNWTLSQLKEIKGDFILADVYLCREKDREAIKSLGKCRWIFFENNPEKCMKNVEYRADGRAVMGMIRTMSKIYTIPEGIKPRKIWSSTSAGG
jgi:hypothetical protein